MSIELVDVELDEVEELEEELLELDDKLLLLDELLLEEVLLDELLLEEALLSFDEVASILLVLLPPMVNSQAVIVKARRLKVLNRKCLFFILFASIWLYSIIFAFY